MKIRFPVGQMTALGYSQYIQPVDIVILKNSEYQNCSSDNERLLSWLCMIGSSTAFLDK